MSQMNSTSSREDHPSATLTPEKARQGAILGHMRYVLAISLVLAVGAFVVVYWL